MENFRSKSYRDGTDTSSTYGGSIIKTEPTNMQELRSYSVNYASSLGKIKNSNSSKGSKGSNLQGSSSAKGWSFSDPELQRKRRVAGYKAYSVEGKMKGSFRKSFRWIKDTYSQAVHGWK